MVQLSLIKGLDPKKHIELGKLLSELSDENIMIIGSGFSFHNMSGFSFNNENIADPDNDQFQDWLIDTCCGEDYSEKNREERLISWEGAPHARYCHPREEHLLPLHLCFGASKKRAVKIFDDYIAGKRAIAFRWKY